MLQQATELSISSSRFKFAILFDFGLGSTPQPLRLQDDQLKMEKKMSLATACSETSWAPAQLASYSL